MSEEREKTGTAPKRRSGAAVMMSLIGLVRPLLGIMAAAVVLGTAGYLCAIFLTILAGQAVIGGLLADQAKIHVLLGGMWPEGDSVKQILWVMFMIAVCRGILHYAEQYCNHFIAFKLLAVIRHKAFAALRKLCPAKLEGREKGNLISIITTDIELLEVFYAHTISPAAIAVLTSAIMVAFIGRYHWAAGALALTAYCVVGIVIPVWNGRRGGGKGMEFRTYFGELNSFVLDSLRGLDETIQYGCGEQRKAQMTKRSGTLAGMQESLSRLEGSQRSVTNAVILSASFLMLMLTGWLCIHGRIGFDGMLTCTIAMMGSFGPTVALSSLSNNLNQTLASGERVLSLLEEKPLVEEIPGDGRKEDGVPFQGTEVRDVTFAYKEEKILDHYSVKLEPGKITGIHGPSGCGKSTLLKLIMRFWDVQSGNILVDGADVRNTATKHLRDMESYVTQETYIFHDSIANNIAVGRPGASRAEIEEAARKASVHEFIKGLPDGYDTKAGELGDTLSSGEKQRIGIARAFLHDAPLLLLDEPTSNLDSLNEGIILKALKESAKQKTVVLVSHRESTMRAADRVVEMEAGTEIG